MKNMKFKIGDFVVVTAANDNIKKEYLGWVGKIKGVNPHELDPKKEGSYVIEGLGRTPCLFLENELRKVPPCHYRPGDRVRIVSEWIGQPYEEEANKYLGTVMTIRSRSYSPVLQPIYSMVEDNGEFIWCEHDIAGKEYDEDLTIQKSCTIQFDKFNRPKVIVQNSEGTKIVPDKNLEATRDLSAFTNFYKNMEELTTEYYSGKVVYIGKGSRFIRGKIYEIKNGQLTDKYGKAQSNIKDTERWFVESFVKLVE